MKTPLPISNEGRTLTDRVTTSLRDAILKAHFEPGERIDISEVASEFSVSRTPVREAINRLASEGLVDDQPHHGTYVATLSRKDIKNIYSVRCLLEVEAVLELTPMITKQTLDQLDALVQRELLRLENQDTSRHAMADIAFHKQLLKELDNPLLESVWDYANQRSWFVRHLTNLQPAERLIEPVLEHQAVLRAMRQGDAEEAAKSMRIHLNKSSERLQALPWVQQSD
jgi:DNA-binding GntR family transcriptional regulator